MEKPHFNKTNFISQKCPCTFRGAVGKDSITVSTVPKHNAAKWHSSGDH